jgi:hypothetical protein
MIDLIGDEIKQQVISEAKRKPTVRKGYAATPGTGPQGETCKTCAHAFGNGNYGQKVFYKCALLKHCWTSGYGTDILLKSPACRYWEKEQG